MEKKKTLLGFNPLHENHANVSEPSHPEHRNRVDLSYLQLRESGLLRLCDVHYEIDDCIEIRCHSPFYSGLLARLLNATQYEADEFANQYDSVFTSPGSARAAVRAMNCCRTLVTEIMTGNYENGFAVVRPPGHHAEKSKACGFCLINNAAEAAEQAILDGADRILIVDLDVHHGQGTQQLFYNSSNVLYFSIHRYQRGQFWPYLAESNYDHTGSGEGKGFNVNIPLNETGCTDADYLNIFWNVLWPLANEFQPQLVIVSAGFDSCIGDPLGEMKMTPDCYAHLIYHLKAFAGGKLLMILEGGYNHRVVADAVDRCVRVLTGAHPLPLNLEAPKRSVTQSCLNAINILRCHWNCFNLYKFTAGSGQFSMEVGTDGYDPDGDMEEPARQKPVRRNTGRINQKKLLEYQNPKRPSLHKSDPSFYPLSTFLAYRQNSGHSRAGHVEHPDRVERIQEAFKHELEQYCQIIEPKVIDKYPFDPAILEATHERFYLERLERTANMRNEELAAMGEESSIYFTQDTYKSTVDSAKSCCAVIDYVMKFREPANAFAVVRPPGHHASSGTPSGFCFFNNVAISVNYARKKYQVKKVLILDWDIHHGNGTQQIFEEDGDVLLISLHRSDGHEFYPASEVMASTQIGNGAGRGFNVNIAWNNDCMGDSEYLAAFSKIVMPIAYEFNPELVMISAGFDAALNDPLGGGYYVSPFAYSMMTYMLSSLANGKVVAVLEGGYNIDSIVEASCAVLKTLIAGKPLESTCPLKKANSHAIDDIRNVLRIQSPHWKCLQGYQVLTPDELYPVVNDTEME